MIRHVRETRDTTKSVIPANGAKRREEGNSLRGAEPAMDCLPLAALAGNDRSAATKPQNGHWLKVLTRSAPTPHKKA